VSWIPQGESQAGAARGSIDLDQDLAEILAVEQVDPRLRRDNKTLHLEALDEKDPDVG
jgi:hypothetical protein